MGTNQKTIRMPAALADKWLGALRSGKYRQGKNALRSDDADGTGYCCLGVLQMVADGKVETRGLGSGVPIMLPSFGWLDNHGVQFTGLFGTTGTSPGLPSLGCSANHANDSGDYNFAQIADAIEDALERT